MGKFCYVLLQNLMYLSHETLNDEQNSLSWIFLHIVVKIARDFSLKFSCHLLIFLNRNDYVFSDSKI